MDIVNSLESIFLKYGNSSVTVELIESFVEKYKSGYKLVLFGCGNQGKAMIRAFNNLNIKVSFLCDNNSRLWGNSILGIKCISLEELKNIKNVMICISSSYAGEINNQLKNIGMNDVYTFGEFTIKLTSYEISNILKNKKKFLEVLELLDDEISKQVFLAGISQWFNGTLQFPQELISNNQFFDDSVYKLSDKEVMIDVGAYNGDTVDMFCKATNNVFEKIYAFELNSSNFKSLVKNILKKNVSEKILCINKGVANINGKVYFSNDDTGSKICDQMESSTLGDVCRLDDTIEYATIIKMDIEGAELEALQGAKQLIKNCKPKLAICIYHKPSDFFEIPLYIKSLVPEYKFAVRHYTSVETETVLYAFI